MDGLTPGRVVHFVSDRWVRGSVTGAVGHEPEWEMHVVLTDEGDHVPATITRADAGDGNPADGRVWLSIDYPGVALPVAALARYDEKGLKPGTWHWIERA